MSDFYTANDINVKAYIGDQLADGEYKHVKTAHPRYKWLPRFFMRWPRFVIEGVSHFYELKEVPPAGSVVTMMYEMDGWEVPAMQFDATAFTPEHD